MDSHDVETFSLDDENIIDESTETVETDTTEQQPVIPSKKWMGKYETPEELEQYAFRISQERKELERQLREKETANEVETVDPDVKKTFDKAYKEEYEDLYEEALEEYGSRENIPPRRMKSIERKALKAAQAEGDRVFLFKEVQKTKLEASTRNDVEYQAVRELIENDPELSRRKNDPQVWEIGKQFLRSAGKLSQRTPVNPPKEQPRYTPAKSSRTKETQTDDDRKYSSIGREIFGAEFDKYDVWRKK